MSYLVIARKWRPRTFEEVIGQPHATRTLQNAIRLERIAHAYLFTGARGVGKTSVARILAKSLNCENGPSPTPCDQCSNCREIAAGNSVDVLEIDGASNRGIDNIRELRETVRYRPAKGRFKVYIIDEVHMLTTEAFNALLKTLEEPPSHVIFIFATTEPHKIPATILSRCQRFDFRRVALSGLVDHLKRITEGEGAHFSDGVLFAIAREADGSMRDAQSLLEQLLAFSGDGLPDEEILDILGVIDRRSVLRAGEAVLSGDAAGCLDLVDDLYRRGIDCRRFCQHLCDHFRNLLFMSIGQGRDTKLDLPSEEKEYLKAQARLTTADSLHVFFQMLLRGEEEIRRSSMPKIALEMLLLRMAQLPGLESLDALLDRITVLESGLRPGGQTSDSRSALPADRSSNRRGSAAEQQPVRSSPTVPERDFHSRSSDSSGVAIKEPREISRNSDAGSNRAASGPLGAPVKPPAPEADPPESSGSSTAPDVSTPAVGLEPGISPESKGPQGERAALSISDNQGSPSALDSAVLPESLQAQHSPPVEPVQEVTEPRQSETISIRAEAPGSEEEVTSTRAASPEAAIGRWPEFIRYLESANPILWAKVSHCGIRAASENCIELEVPDLFEKSANGPEFLEKLRNASDAFFGHGLDWVIIKKEGTRGAPAQKTKAPKSTGKQIVGHPAVQQAIEVLGAELVEVKPKAGSGKKAG